MDRQKYLLLFAAVLLVMKFVILPVYDYRDELANQLESAQEHLAKRHKVFAEVELLKGEQAKIEETLSLLQGEFTQAIDHEFAKLTFQKKLEEQAREHGVVLQNIEWSEVVDGTPSSADLEVRFEAPFKSVMLFHSQLADAGYDVYTRELFTSVQRQRLGAKKLGNAKGTLSLSIYYLVQAQ